MSPKEADALLSSSRSSSPSSSYQKGDTHMSILDRETSFGVEESSHNSWKDSICRKPVVAVLVAVSVLVVLIYGVSPLGSFDHRLATGPYKLVECQQGRKFFDFYNFLDGPDSLGSAGHNDYVSRETAESLGIFNVTVEKEDEEYIYMSSVPTAEGPRHSIRLEGKRRFDRGLFVLDLQHMPYGCGVWPAWWLTDEAVWPDHGEIDVVEGINTQTQAKTALHTSESCSMYAQVSPYQHTGHWDSATGIFDTFTGLPDNVTHVPADNCWVMAPHQWANQGCVAVHAQDDSLGEPLNQNGGGVFVLDWDPANNYIQSYVFRQDGSTDPVPENLQRAMDTASSDSPVAPDPASWNALPYAYFAIGNNTGCSSDHFQNMRLVMNLAFCGNVAGNRFAKDCPALAKEFAPLVKQESSSDSSHSLIDTCNAYIESNPEALKEAYWKIRGVYVYERELE